MNIKYMNYMSEYEGQYQIGNDKLENASIPVIDIGNGKYKYVADFDFRTLSIDMRDYEYRILKSDIEFYAPKRCITDEPKFIVPFELIEYTFDDEIER